MGAPQRRRRRSRDTIAADLEVLPMMNLFIVLIPLLLLSAVFVEVSVIDMAMPSDSEASEAKQEPLGLAVHINDDGYVLVGRNIPTQVFSRTANDASADIQLSEALVAIASAHPDNQQIKIVSQPTTLYDEIIGVMDIARAAGLPSTALIGADGAS